tara:strand:- start:3079 stop:6342 length:3264 start_codon:yes stop_codon:yes gene_type:complete
LLTIYSSNKAEFLANLLAEKISEKPKDIFETQEILINNWTMSLWLKEEISLRNGISSLCEFPLAGKYIHNTVNKILGINKDYEYEWTDKRLVWEILDIIPRLDKYEEANEILNIIKTIKDDNLTINNSLWNFANTIAETYEKYFIYRPFMIKNWWDNNYNFKNIIDIKTKEYWQPLIIQLLKERKSHPPFPIKIINAIEKINNNQIKQLSFPNKIYIFGITHLAPIQINFIKSFSSIIDIDMFITAPSPDIWKILLDSNYQSKDCINISDSSINMNRIERILGRHIGEFQQIIEGTGEYQKGEFRDNKIYILNKVRAVKEKRKPYLLEQIQDKLISLNNYKLSADINDDSILFIGCNGIRNQIEIVKYKILDILSKNKDLDLRDIIIISPQINIFKPFIPSIFNAEGIEDVKIPYYISSEENQINIGIYRLILDLIRISLDKFSLLSLDILLSHKEIKDAYNLSEEDINKILNLLKDSGFSGGINKSEKNGLSEKTLEWCIDRMLLGILYDDEIYLEERNITPYKIEINISSTIKWLNLLRKIENSICKLREAKNCQDWINCIKEIIIDIFPERNNNDIEVINLFNQLEEWNNENLYNQNKISGKVAYQVIERLLKCNDKFLDRQNKINIGNMNLVKGIPYKIIFIIGLDDKSYPRKDKRDNFNLIYRKRYIGDPSNFDIDKHYILENLISSREKIYFLWNKKSQESARPVNPSIIIENLINIIKQYINSELSNIIIKSEEDFPIPLSQASIQKNIELDHISDSKKKNKEVYKLYNGLIQDIQWDFSFKSSSKDIDFNALCNWISNPQLYWLINKGLDPREFNNYVFEESDIEINSLIKYQIRQIAFELLIDQLLDNDINNIDINNIDLFQTIKGKGKLPLINQGIYECQEIYKSFTSLISILASYKDITKDIIKFKNNHLNLFYSDDYIIEIKNSKVDIHFISKCWIKYLYLNKQGFKKKGLVIISKDKNNYKQTRFSSLEINKSNEILEEINLNFIQSRETCWPIPPESGFIYVKEQLKGNDPATSFEKNWIGHNKYNKGESQKPEMEYCFGFNRNYKFFIESEIFHKLAMQIYMPIISHIFNKK